MGTVGGMKMRMIVMLTNSWRTAQSEMKLKYAMESSRFRNMVMEYIDKPRGSTVAIRYTRTRNNVVSKEWFEILRVRTEKIATVKRTASLYVYNSAIQPSMYWHSQSSLTFTELV